MFRFISRTRTFIRFMLMEMSQLQN